MLVQRPVGARKDGLAAKTRILLWNPAPGARSAACRDEQADGFGLRGHAAALAEPILARQRVCPYLAAPP